MPRNAVLAFSLFLASLWMTSPLKAANAALGSQWVAYGQKLYAAQQYDKAISAFTTAAKANSGDPQAWKGLGYSFYAKRDYTSALKYCKYALQLNPNDAGLSQFTQRLTASTAQPGAGAPGSGNAMALANRYYQAKQYPYAIQQYNVVLSSDPNNAVAYQYLGNCYYAQGDKPHAVQAFKHAIALNPNNVALKSFLARYSPEDARESGVQVAEGPKDWAQPLWRSAVLPGWGQSYNGDGTKAWLVGGVTLGALAGTVATYVIGDNARKTYEGLTDANADYDTPYNTWESMATLNHVFAITFLTAYTFNLVDAILGAKADTHALGMNDLDQKPVQLGLMPQGVPGVTVQLLKF